MKAKHEVLYFGTYRKAFIGLTILLFAIFICLSALILNPVPAIPSTISGSNVPIDLVTLDEGRFRIVAENLHSLQFDVGKKLTKPHWLMIRQGTRKLIPLPKTDSNHVTVQIENPGGKLILDEVGIYEKNPNRFPTIDAHIVKMAFKVLRIAASLLGIFFIFYLPRSKTSLYYVFALGLTTFASIVFVKFSPEWSRDLKVTFTSGTLQKDLDHNFYYGLSMASSILDGKGPLIDGMPPWCRMPGYGFLLTCVKSGPSLSIENLLQATIKGVWLHIFLIVSSLTFFFWAFQRLVSPFAAMVAVSGILLLPTNALFLLIIESIMPAVALFSLGAGSVYLWHYYNRAKIPMVCHVLLHGSFALWFFIRTDVLPAWAIVSALLYAKRVRDWKYFLIPLSFVLSIGLPWALFKMPYIGAFSMTTESVGASFMGGLWEVPHKFIWTPTDGAYINWVESQGFDYTTKAASDFAVNECLRFCLTYPIYILSLIWHKFTVFLHLDQWAALRIFFLTIPLIAMFIRYKRMQALLLGWMIYFNMPLFFIFYSSGGRFYDPVYISMIAVGCSFLFDRGFYAQALKNLRPICIVLAFAAATLLFGEKIDQRFLAQDRLRYWAPFLDPAQSTLSVGK